MADRIAVMADGRVQQVAPPQDLYRGPANRFVADFIGTSNRFAGVVDGDRFVAEEVGPLPRPADASVAGPSHLVVRPEHVSMTPGTDAAAGLLTGKVADVQFKGGSSQVAVDVPGLSSPFLVTVGGTAAVTRGDQVSLDWTHAVVVTDALA